MTLSEKFSSLLSFISSVGEELERSLASIDSSRFDSNYKNGAKDEKRAAAGLKVQGKINAFIQDVDAEGERLRLAIFKLRSPLESSEEQGDRLLASNLRLEGFQFASLAEKPEAVLSEALEHLRRPDYAFSLLSWAEKRFERLPYDWKARIHEGLDVPLGVDLLLDELKSSESFKRQAVAWLKLSEQGVWRVSEQDEAEAGRLGIQPTDFLRIQVQRRLRAAERGKNVALMQA